MRRQLSAFIFVALPLATAMAAPGPVDRGSLDPEADASTDFSVLGPGKTW